jgi:WD40 repeat protein
MGLKDLIHDACRFITYHKRGIENNPLQAYASALVFSPTRSLTRIHFRKEEPKWITIKPAMTDKWGACLQTLEGHGDWVGSVAFSHDSARLASASRDTTVKIWDASSGECLQTLQIGSVLLNISFDTTGSYLHTKMGTIAIDASSASNMTPSATDPQNPRYQGCGLSSDGAWITYNSENVVWLPSEYRPSCSAVSEKTISIGVGSGKVWVCNFKVDDSS